MKSTPARRLPERFSTGRPAPVAVTRVHPQVWDLALRLAEHDHKRLVIEPDGSVLVIN